MRVASEKVDDGTITTTTTEGAETPAPVVTVEKTASTATTEPALPNREANEKLIGRGVSTRERRTNTPPVLVRLNRHKAQVHEETRTRTEECSGEGGKKKAVEREVVKRRQFEEFAATQFVGGIVEGMQARTHLMRTQAESRLDETNTEFAKFDDGDHFEHRVLHEREAEARRIEREQDQETAVAERLGERETETRTSTDRWIEQRELEQQAIEQKAAHERDLINARSEASSRTRSRGDDPRADEYNEEQMYYEHNILNRERDRRRDD